eukprot:4906218-Prymnesium_polylepis.1
MEMASMASGGTRGVRAPWRRGGVGRVGARLGGQVVSLLEVAQLVGEQRAVEEGLEHVRRDALHCPEVGARLARGGEGGRRRAGWA